VADVSMPVAILCGGRGTRLQERTHAIPKALVEIGGRPILWHVIRIYAAHGLRRFVLLTGYLGEMVADFSASTQWPDGVVVECVDTGLQTPTGGRVALAAERLADGPFHLTYADGVDRVSRFDEKPRLDHWVNGGFFCFEPAFLSYLEPSSVLEREPLRRLAADGELAAFRHHGFWDCMDTYKDAIELNDLWQSGEAPWRAWDSDPEPSVP
jgi:glucose-1-phosphate cytidylyltransferase